MPPSFRRAGSPRTNGNGTGPENGDRRAGNSRSTVRGLGHGPHIVNCRARGKLWQVHRSIRVPRRGCTSPIRLAGSFPRSFP